MNFVKGLANLFTQQSCKNFQQIRATHINRWMIRDVKRRRMTTEMAPTRLRINSLRKNDILPVEIKELATAEIQAMSSNTSTLRCNKRCVITSRPRGVVYRWRLSRIVFRDLADYNKLSGVERAMW